MTHPHKRPRLHFVASEPPEADVELASARKKNDNLLKTRWENVFARYEKDFTGIGDEIDFLSGEVLVDNGHIQSMHRQSNTRKTHGLPSKFDGRSMLRTMTAATPDYSDSIAETDEVFQSIETIVDNAMLSGHSSEDDLFDVATPALSADQHGNPLHCHTDYAVQGCHRCESEDDELTGVRTTRPMSADSLFDVQAKQEDGSGMATLFPPTSGIHSAGRAAPFSHPETVYRQTSLRDAVRKIMQEEKAQQVQIEEEKVEAAWRIPVRPSSAARFPPKMASTGGGFAELKEDQDHPTDPELHHSPWRSARRIRRPRNEVTAERNLRRIRAESDDPLQEGISSEAEPPPLPVRNCPSSKSHRRLSGNPLEDWTITDNVSPLLQTSSTTRSAQVPRQGRHASSQKDETKHSNPTDHIRGCKGPTLNTSRGASRISTSVMERVSDNSNNENVVSQVAREQSSKISVGNTAQFVFDPDEISDSDSDSDGDFAPEKRIRSSVADSKTSSRRTLRSARTQAIQPQSDATSLVPPEIVQSRNTKGKKTQENIPTNVVKKADTAKYHPADTEKLAVKKRNRLPRTLLADFCCMVELHEQRSLSFQQIQSSMLLLSKTKKDAKQLEKEYRIYRQFPDVEQSHFRWSDAENEKLKGAVRDSMKCPSNQVTMQGIHRQQFGLGVARPSLVEFGNKLADLFIKESRKQTPTSGIQQSRKDRMVSAVRLVDMLDSVNSNPILEAQNNAVGTVSRQRRPDSRSESCPSGETIAPGPSAAQIGVPMSHTLSTCASTIPRSKPDSLRKALKGPSRQGRELISIAPRKDVINPGISV